MPESTRAEDSRAFRNALGSFLTGVTVVTATLPDGTRRGFTANSFTSVSLEPPLVLVCLARNSSSHDVFTTSPGFAVNVLAEHQREIASRFATRHEDRFAVGDWRTGPGGNPVLDDAAAWFDCSLERVDEGGDHVILLGRAVGFATSGANPLGYLRGSFVLPGLAGQALATGQGSSRIGAVLEDAEGRILLVEDAATGALAPPVGSRLGHAGAPGSLAAVLAALEVEARVGFLFAVYEGADGHSTWVFHRGEIVSGPGAGTQGRLYAVEDIPWARVSDPAVVPMLRRFIAERAAGDGRFGIYSGSAETGHVHTIEPTGRAG